MLTYSSHSANMVLLPLGSLKLCPEILFADIEGRADVLLVTLR
jgi:hypothetical protein